jgi:hypothetical protein
MSGRAREAWGASPGRRWPSALRQGRGCASCPTLAEDPQPVIAQRPSPGSVSPWPR